MLLYEHKKSDLGVTYAVVEASAGDMRKVSEAVPLGSGLRVHCVQVVIRNTFVESLDLMLEYFTTKCWLAWNIEGKTRNHVVSSQTSGCSDPDENM